MTLAYNDYYVWNCKGCMKLEIDIITYEIVMAVYKINLSKRKNWSV